MKWSDGGTADATWVDKFNQLVRSICVLMLLATLCLAFLWGVYREKPVVSTDAFVAVMAAAITWLFKSRDEQREQQQRADTMPTTTTSTSQDGGPTVTQTGPAPPNA